MCKLNATKIVAHHQSETEGVQQELAEDLMAVCNFFVARNNGRRGGRNKRHTVTKDQVESNSGVEGTSEQVDGDVQMDV